MFGIFGSGKDKKQDSIGIRKYEELKNCLKNRELRKALDRIASGDTRMPISIAMEAQSAVAEVNYLANLIGVSGGELISAIGSGSYDKKLREIILQKEQDAGEAFSNDAIWVQELVSWANQNNLPEFESFSSPAYRQTGFPRDGAGLASLECIHLPSCGLQLIPDAIKNLKKVQAICLDDNSFEELPAGICELRGLIRLDLDDNCIRKLPKEIGNLVNLQTVSMSNNSIEDFPIEMLELKSLRKLDVAGNKIHLSSRYSPLSEAGFSVYHHFDEIIKQDNLSYWLKNTDVSSLTITG